MEDEVTPEEARLLRFFRYLSDVEQDAVFSLIDNLAETAKTEQRLTIPPPLLPPHRH